MADIKSRDVVKGTIKKIDKAAIAAGRMRSAYVQTKEKAEHATHPDEHNAEEYASDRVEGGVDRITHEAAHQFDKQGRKGLEETKRNVSKAKDGVQKFREKRAAELMKRQTVRTSGNKTIKAVEQTEKTIKQSARSAGKKTIKTAGKGTAKAAQRAVKTTKTAIKTTQQAAKTAQKTAQATVKASQKAAQAAKAEGNGCWCKSCRKSNDCGGQSNHCGNKSIGRCYCRRRLGRCDDDSCCGPAGLRSGPFRWQFRRRLPSGECRGGSLYALYPAVRRGVRNWRVCGAYQSGDDAGVRRQGHRPHAVL